MTTEYQFKDIEYILNWEKVSDQVEQKHLFVEFSEVEQCIADCLKKKGKPVIDEICKETQLNMSKVSSVLLELEFKGVVRSLPGKMYELTGKLS